MMIQQLFLYFLVVLVIVTFASSVKSEDDNQIFGTRSRYDNKKKLLEMTQLQFIF